MMQPWRVVGFLVWASVAGATQVVAQQPASLGGVVLDPRGMPAPRIALVAKGGTDTERNTITAPDGTFLMERLEPGKYVLVVADPAYASFSQEIVLAAGEDREITIQLRFTVPDFAPVTDRWRLSFPQWTRYPSDPNSEYPFVPNRGADPYDQNVLKGDLPIIGNDVFMILTAILETPFEYRRVPTPSGVSTERPQGEEFFGENPQYAVLPSGIASFELFRGSTAFKPRDWAVRVTPQFNLNYVHTRERNVVNVSPEKGATRRDELFTLQEAFGEVKLFDVGPNFDFVSVRAGIQPFNSDFRGFLFRDTNFGVRAFGTSGRNRNQWNVAMFDQLEKDTNSELNLLERRDQRVFIANYYRQDFLTPGYTISPSFHANLDRGEELFYDHNGFLVRPAPIGVVRPHRVSAYYVGVGGDGHVGRLNITHQFYQAFGEDELNGIAGQPVDINAQFAAVEASVDQDWLRYRIGFVYASGDGDPADDRANGFDGIVDDPNIIGGPFSFWSRQSLKLAQTGVGLVGRNSVLPALRSSKAEGQANFVNPGVVIVSGGVDSQWTTKTRTTVTANYLQFHRTEVLRRVLFQDSIEKSIGLDIGFGVQHRPALNDNVVLTAGYSILLPGQGFKQVLTDSVLSTAFAVLTLTY